MSIKRLTFLLCGILLSCPCAGAASESDSVSLPGEGGTLPAVEYPYFPDRQHAFVWRNWTLVPAARLAEVLATSEENVNRLAASMGLRPQRGIEPYWSDARGYITVLRRNWHLLPYDQLLTLLGLTREELAWRLIEDDFLFVKLGNVKPACEPLRYRAPDERAMRGAARIDSLLGTFGREAFAREEPRFSFIEEFRRPRPVKRAGRTETESPEERFDLRLIFSYFAAYGDPLTDPDLSSYPEGLLQRLSEKGINGIWIHSVLRTLVEPDGILPGADDASRRIEGLRRLVERAARYGIGVYFFVCERASCDARFVFRGRCPAKVSFRHGRRRSEDFMHVVAGGQKLAEPFVGERVPAGPRTCGRFFDHGFRESDQLRFARKPCGMQSLCGAFLCRADRRSQYGDFRGGSPPAIRKRGCWFGIGDGHGLAGPRDHPPPSEIVLADVGQRVGVADRAWRSRLGRGRVFAVGCRAGAEGNGPLALCERGRIEDGRQGPSQCFVGNGRGSSSARAGFGGPPCRQPGRRFDGRRDAQLESGRLSVCQSGTVPVARGRRQRGGLEAIGRKVLREAGRPRSEKGRGKLSRMRSNSSPITV